jgi:hypothetical protein
MEKPTDTENTGAVSDCPASTGSVTYDNRVTGYRESYIDGMKATRKKGSTIIGGFPCWRKKWGHYPDMPRLSDSQIRTQLAKLRTDKRNPRAYGLVNAPDQAMRWLERLTPGGSEFHDEPENCFNHIIRERDSRWETIKRQQRRIRELEALLSPNDQDETRHEKD